MRRLEAIAARYTEDEFRRYEDELGWQSWMEEFTDAEDGEPCSERELEEIHKIVIKAWYNVHVPC